MKSSNLINYSTDICCWSCPLYFGRLMPHKLSFSKFSFWGLSSVCVCLCEEFVFELFYSNNFYLFLLCICFQYCCCCCCSGYLLACFFHNYFWFIVQTHIFWFLFTAVSGRSDQASIFLWWAFVANSFNKRFG